MNKETDNAEYYQKTDEDRTDVETIPTDHISEMRRRYDTAKSAKVKENCKCAYCSLDFVKNSYQQSFCKRGKCKDRYWNTVDESRRIRSGLYGS